MTKDIQAKNLHPSLSELQFEHVDGIRTRYPNTPQMQIIRELESTLEDTSRLADCINEWSEGDSWGGGFGNTKFSAERILKEFFTVKLTRRMVVDEEGLLQGYCSVDEHWTDEDSMYVELVGVRPSQQKRGFGKGLLLKAIETAFKYGKRRLDLHTWAGNLRAVPVYKKTGFMWCPKTSVLMENFIPAILGTKFFQPFFAKNDWYESRKLTVTQKDDSFEKSGMKAYFYHFVQDDQNSLRVYIDRHAKEISGFSYLINGKELSIQLTPNSHEAFLGIDPVAAELCIKNQLNEPISMIGIIKPFKGIKVVSPNSINVTIPPKGEKRIPLNVELCSDAETYILDQQPYRRTDCRFHANLEVKGQEIQLAVGWVPKASFQVLLSDPSVSFGKFTKQAIVPVGFRNMLDHPFDGRIKITGEGLVIPHEVGINLLESGDALETQVEIQRPEEPTVAAWKWKIQFYQRKSGEEVALPPIILHVSCFTKPGAVAYVNPHKEAVIENEQIRFQFGLKETNEMKLVTVKDRGEFYFWTFGMGIGKPFPDESSEFWRIDRPYIIVQRDSGVSFKQTMLSKVEKPGLQVTRWIDVEAGKPFISCYYEITNTSENILENVAIRHWSPWRTPEICSGKYILPLTEGWLVSDDSEFNDNYDFPKMATEYMEPWLAKKNELGFGCGLIWDADQVDTIRGNPFNGPVIDTKSYALQSGETIKLGHFTWVFGESITRITRNTWLNEFNGTKSINVKDKDDIEYCNSILEVRCGQDLMVPKISKNPLPGLHWIDVDSSSIPIDIFYHARRETPIEAQIYIHSSLWSSPFQMKLKLESGDESTLQMKIPLIKQINSQDTLVIPLTGSIQLPYSSRPITGVIIPYKSSGKVSLEKIDDHWIFSNNLLSFRTSPSHGASLFSAKFNDGKELFFSRFPNRDSFVWFKRFIGGFHPFIKAPNHWDWVEFLENVWSEPVIVENNDWVGLSYQLESPDNDFRLKNIACTITYFTRYESPLLWGQLSFKNNSGVTVVIEAGFFLYLKPIHELYTRRHNKIWTYTRTEKQRVLHTVPPDNWAISSFGETKEKILMSSINPKITLRGDYMNANKYSELVCHHKYKLAPGMIRKLDVPLLFSKKGSVEEMSAIFAQRREVIQL